jgi:accessory gene regulator protein AgrB
MLERLAVFITQWLHTNSNNTDYDKLENKIKVLLIYLLLFPILIIIGLKFNILGELCITTIAMIFLRLWNGGHHFHTVDSCFTITLLSLLLPSVIVSYLFEYISIMNIISFILILLYSPYENKNNKKSIKKLVSLAICIIFSLISPIISTTIFIQSVDLIKLKHGSVQEE